MSIFFKLVALPFIYSGVMQKKCTKPKNIDNKKNNFVKEFVKSVDIDISDFEYTDELLSEAKGQINE